MISFNIFYNLRELFVKDKWSYNKAFGLNLLNPSFAVIIGMEILSFFCLIFCIKLYSNWQGVFTTERQGVKYV